MLFKSLNHEEEEEEKNHWKTNHRKIIIVGGRVVKETKESINAESGIRAERGEC